jgi:hypothetical protein
VPAPFTHKDALRTSLPRLRNLNARPTRIGTSSGRERRIEPLTGCTLDSRDGARERNSEPRAEREAATRTSSGESGLGLHDTLGWSRPSQWILKRLRTSLPLLGRSPPKSDLGTRRGQRP